MPVDETSVPASSVNPHDSSAIANLEPSAQGEVAGSFLLGLVQSFYNLNALPQGGLNFDLGQIEPEGWYPHELLIDTLGNIKQAIPASDSLFFQAGVNFLRIWYEHGPGKAMIHSTLDWLHANDESGGYNTVVRGGTQDEIGWCRVKTIDEQAGVAVIENVTPLTVEYVKGVFYGGCLIFDDLDYVSVEGKSEAYDGNPTFNKVDITVHFRLKPKEVPRDLDDCLKALHTGSPLSLSQNEIERLAWRYQWTQYKRNLDKRYFNDINVVLAQATLESQRITRELSTSEARLKLINEQLEASNRKITTLSITDRLTQLANRFQLDQVLDESLQLATRYGSPFSVILLDIDHFKHVNDTYGHMVGDDVLVQVAKVLTTNTRSVDKVGRWGGEEFLVIAPSTGLDDTALLAEKLRKAIDKTDFPAVGRKSCSFGVASYIPGDDLEKLIGRADAAMYAAKNAGRNRVEISVGNNQIASTSTNT